MKVEIEKYIQEAITSLNKTRDFRDKVYYIIAEERESLKKSDFTDLLEVYTETVVNITRLEHEIDAMMRSLERLDMHTTLALSSL